MFGINILAEITTLFDHNVCNKRVSDCEHFAFSLKLYLGLELHMHDLLIDYYTILKIESKLRQDVPLCILYLFHSAMFIKKKNMHVGVNLTHMMVWRFHIIP